MALFVAIMTIFLYNVLESQAVNQPVMVPLFILFAFGIIDQFKSEKNEAFVPYVKKDFYGLIF
jgi:hypothetical protein